MSALLLSFEGAAPHEVDAIAPAQENRAMKNDEDFRTRVVRAMGTIMMLAWTLILGPLGALLLGGTAYAMFVQDAAIGTLCGVLFFFPLLSTAVWGVLKFLEFHREKRVREIEFDFGTEQVDPANR